MDNSKNKLINSMKEIVKYINVYVYIPRREMNVILSLGTIDFSKELYKSIVKYTEWL